MITISFSTAQWVALAITFISMTVQLYCAYLARQRVKLLNEREAALDAWSDALKAAQPEQIAERIQKHIAGQMGEGADLLERALGDLDYLHESLYKDRPHPADCPTCSNTRSGLERVIAGMKTARIDVQGRRE